MLHHHLLHEDNECSRTDFTLELRRRYNYILHKFLADRADLFGQCGTEHHDLLLVWRHAENFLDISSHIWKLKVQRNKNIETVQCCIASATKTGKREGFFSIVMSP